MVEILALNPDASRDKVDVAIERIRLFQPPDGYWLAFSGGKDSQAVYHLAQQAGAQFDAHYNVSLEPPELKEFIREYYPDVAWERRGNFWQHLEHIGFPTRQHRWCCEFLKEWGGEGRTVLTGVRWAESTSRKRLRSLVDHPRHSRYSSAPKVCVNPIIDWTTADVWAYLHVIRVPHCSLYDEGLTRLGCVLCPMQSPSRTKVELKRYPKIALAWEHAFRRLYERRENEGKQSIDRWESSDAMWHWWLSRKNSQENPQQGCFIFE